MLPKISLYNAAIETRSGTEIGTAASAAGRIAIVAAFCRTECDPDDPDLPPDDEDLIEYFFEGSSRYSVYYDETTLRFKPQDITWPELPPHEPDRWRTYDGYEDSDRTNGRRANSELLPILSDRDDYVDLITNALHAAHAAGHEPWSILTAATDNFINEACKLPINHPANEDRHH